MRLDAIHEMGVLGLGTALLCVWKDTRREPGPLGMETARCGLAPTIILYYQFSLAYGMNATTIAVVLVGLACHGMSVKNCASQCRSHA